MGVVPGQAARPNYPNLSSQRPLQARPMPRMPGFSSFESSLSPPSLKDVSSFGWAFAFPPTDDGRSHRQLVTIGRQCERLLTYRNWVKQIARQSRRLELVLPTGVVAYLSIDYAGWAFGAGCTGSNARQKDERSCICGVLNYPPASELSQTDPRQLVIVGKHISTGGECR